MEVQLSATGLRVNRSVRRSLVAGLVVAGLVIAGLAGCGAGEERWREGGTALAGEERFPRGVLWAHRSTIHLDSRSYDVSPWWVDSMDWTPYGLFLGLRPARRGGRDYYFFDGQELHRVRGNPRDISTSWDGRYAAWMDLGDVVGPENRTASLTVVDLAEDRVVHRTSEDLDWFEEDDEASTPFLSGISGGRVVWFTADREEKILELDTDGAEGSWPMQLPLAGPTSFNSPDGTYRVDAGTVGKLRVGFGNPDFGHRFQYQAGWLDPETMLVLAKDRRETSWDPEGPDPSRGVLMACNLRTSRCQELRKVVATNQLVFAGVDSGY